MSKDFEQKFEPKNNPSENKEISETENEQLEDIESPLEKSKMIDKSELERDDQRKLSEIRESLRLEMEKNEGWKVVRRSSEEWKQEREITTDHPMDRLKGWLKSFSKTNREAKKYNEELQRNFKEDRVKYPETGFDYKKGAGVEGMAGDKVGILAKGFGECSGLVLQTPNKVAVVHISPNVFRDAFEGGELVRDSGCFRPYKICAERIIKRKTGKICKKNRK